MRIFAIDNRVEVKEIDFSRNKLTELFKLNIRDLRPVFSRLQVATILARDNVTIINFGFIKAVLASDIVYIIDQEDSNSVEVLLDNIKLSLEDASTSTKAPFALKVLEIIFNTKSKQMSDKVEGLISDTEIILPALRKDLSDANLVKVLTLKKRISKIEARLSEILHAAKDVLEDADDFNKMVNIMLNGNKHNVEVELESIFEDFIERIEDEIGHISRLKEEVDDTEDFITLQLSSRRTKIVKFDLFVTMITLPLTFLAVVVGLYGVNIRNGLEESDIAFLILSLVLVVFFIVTLFIMRKILKKNKLL